MGGEPIVPKKILGVVLWWDKDAEVAVSINSSSQTTPLNFSTKENSFNIGKYPNASKK